MSREAGLQVPVDQTLMNLSKHKNLIVSVRFAIYFKHPLTLAM